VIEQLGRYKLTARIATGGMAEVFLARAEGVQGFTRTSVVKRLLPHLAREPAVVEMFLNEARLTGRLDHPNIVQVLDLGQTNGHYYIAMEFLDGRALAEIRDAARAQGGMLPMGFVLKVMAESLAGLHHAHEARSEDGAPLNVVHRDFNPDNISVTYDGRVKVLDFGIAKSQGAVSSTEPGTLKGKYFYMSPEMVLGNPLDRRADIFATGITLYELLCDKRPFEGDTPNAILSGIAYGTPISPRSLNPQIAPELESLILRCMARSPNERPPTAQAVKDELDAILPRVGAFGSAEIAQLMELLFPPGDAERTRINELRKIDPSLPGQSLIAVTPVEPLGTTAKSADVAKLKQQAAPKIKPPKPPSKPLTSKQKMTMCGVAVGALALGLVTWKVILPIVNKPPDAATARLEELEKVYKAAPDDAAAADKYAEGLLAAGKEDNAEKVVDKLLATKDDARAHVIKGDLFLKHRFGTKAMEEYDKAIKLEPNDATALAHRGRMKLAMAQISDARNDLARALQLRPSDKQLVLEVADVEGRAGDWASSLNTLGTSRFQRDAEIHTLMGLAYYNLQDDNNALKQLLAAEKLNRESPRTQLYLGFVYYHQAKPERAIESYRNAIKLTKTPDTYSAQAHDALGDILLGQNDKAGAKSEYAAAIKDDPTIGSKEKLKKLE